MICFYWHCRQISFHCYEGEKCGLAQTVSQSTPSRKITKPDSVITSSSRMYCGGRPGFLLLPLHSEITRSVLSQRKTWTVVDFCKCCGMSWDITATLQLNPKCPAHLLKIRTKHRGWKTVILCKEAEAWCHRAPSQTLVGWGQGQGGASPLGELQSGEAHRHPGILTSFSFFPRQAQQHVFSVFPSPHQCLSNLFAIPYDLPHCPPWLPHCHPSPAACHRQGRQPVIVLTLPLWPLQQGFLMCRVHHNKSLPFGCVCPGFHKNNKFYDHLNSGTKQTNFWWIFTLLLVWLIYLYTFHEEDMNHHANYIFTLFLWDLKGQMKFLDIKDC